MSRPAFGVIFRPTFPLATLADYARRAEAAGFDELWLWDDCFMPGALTMAAIALSATTRIKVGIGLMPATAYNPLFAAMEITSLAGAFPGRILPGFGHGVRSLLARVGAAPQSSLKTLAETVNAVRGLLNGELVTTHQAQVDLESVQMKVAPEIAPPIYLGAMRAKTLQLAGRVGDGTILTEMSSPVYVRWAKEQISIGMAQAGRTGNRLVVFLDAKVGPDGTVARAAVRRTLAERLPWADIHLQISGFTDEVAAFTRGRDLDQVANEMPDEWLDTFSAAGTPQQALDSIRRLVEAGADSIAFLPGEQDPGCLDEYIQHLMPILNSTGAW